MKKLTVKDIAPAIKLVNAINCTKELKEIITKADDAENAGVEIIGLILTKYAENPKAEKKLAEFLSRPFEMSPEEVLDLDIDSFMNGLKEMGGIGSLTNFFVKSLV